MPVPLAFDLDRVAMRSPDSPAITWRGDCWSYASLRRAVGCVQRRLSRSRLAPGSRVAILAQNSPQYVATYYGVMGAGLVAVPLNVHERANVLVRQIGHAECGLVIADAGHAEWARVAEAVATDGQQALAFELRSDPQACEAFCADWGGDYGDSLREPDDRELAMIIFTSGTISRPKGVMLSHGNLAANAKCISDYLETVSSDRVLTPLPFYFSYGNSVLNSNLRCGAHLLLEDNLAFPHLTVRRLQDERATGFPAVPSTFAILLARCSLNEYDLSHLRYVTQAGGPMPRQHIDRLRAQLPNTRVFAMYGQTEATARLTFLNPDLLDKKSGSVGLPLSGHEVEIRDGDASLPPGDVGEICFRGPSVMLGYWRDPEKSSEVLRGGWLHTGDLGHLDADGYLYVDGRAEEMIKVGAFRLSPLEVEEALAAHPDVEEAAVVGVPDEVLGQAVKAVVVRRPGADVTARALQAHCKGLLASYKVPRTVEFVGMLPRTSSGKIQRLKLN